MKIPIFDTAGKIVNSITLPEPVQYVGDRVCKGQKYYYKGVGIPYKYHHIHPQDMTEQYTYIDTCPVFYICLLYTSPSPRDKRQSRMPSSA